MPENILVVCGHGAAGCHGLLTVRRVDAQRLARLAMSEAQEVYCVRKKGWVWLERTYPRGADRPRAAIIAPRVAGWVEIDRAGWPPPAAASDRIR